MRLDHLLSKEMFEGEIRRTHPKVDQSEMTVEESAKSTDCRSKKLTRCIVFRVRPGEADHPRSNLYGGLAQLGERLPCKQEVSGSNPLISIHGSLAQSVRALA